MRFKATLPTKNTTALTAVMSCLEKLDTSCLIHLSEKHVKFASMRSVSKEIQVACELQQNKIFSTFRIESVAGNCILLEIGCSNFLKALTSPRTAPLVCIKLAKRGGQPCICVEARDLDVELMHDIPVKLMRATDIGWFVPPDVPLPQVQLELPGNRSVRAVVDRLKTMDRYCYVDGDMSGSLTLRLENDRVTVKALFGNLIPRLAADEEEGAMAGPPASATVKVDVRKLSAALNFVTQPHDNATCCLVEDLCLILHVELLPRGAGTFTYYLPAFAVGQ